MALDTFHVHANTVINIVACVRNQRSHSQCELLVVSGNNVTTTSSDHSVTIALIILGGVYGVVAASAVIFIILPRMLAGQAAIQAARPTAGMSSMVRAARPRPQGTRWTPSYGGHEASRSRPGAYLPREQLQRVSAISNHRVSAPNQVSLCSLYYSLHGKKREG